MHTPPVSIGRRQFIAGGLAAGAALVTPGFLRSALAATTRSGDGPYGPLGEPDALGLRLPDGFSARQIARGGKLVDGTAYPWHYASDGQAAYRTEDGGWILVANSEAPATLGGGSSAIRFSADARIVGAQRILAGTNLNCAGGPTPWGTWLSCEEHEGGMVWEADPAGRLPAVPRPALGNFAHEAAAVDPADGAVYLTEDQPDGLLYRFRPQTGGDLSAGVLEAAVVDAGDRVTWAVVPDPNLVTQGARTREQVPQATRFDAGEGLWHHDGVIYFTTKGDRTVWAYHAREARLETLYKYDPAAPQALNAVDNVTVAPWGDVYVCEDGGNMEICIITPDGVVAPFVRVEGHDGSELCGVVFDPAAERLYFSSQRAYAYAGGTPAADGAVYEVSGPFAPAGFVVPDGWAFGPPAGERGDALPGGALGLRARPTAGGVRATVTLARPATLDLLVRTSALRSEAWHSGGPDRPVAVTLARARRSLPAGTHAVDLPLAAVAGGLDAVLTATTVAGAGRRAEAVAFSLPRG